MKVALNSIRVAKEVSKDWTNYQEEEVARHKRAPKKEEATTSTATPIIKSTDRMCFVVSGETSVDAQERQKKNRKN